MRGGAYSDTISRIFGSFDALKGHRYVVEIMLLRDAPELDVTNPRLVVQTFPGYWEGTFLLLQLTFFLALITTILTLPFLIRRAIRFLKRPPSAPIS